MIQYSNSDQSLSLSSPPILSPPGFTSTQQSTAVSKSRRKRKSSFPRKNVRQEFLDLRDHDFQDSAYIDIDNTIQVTVDDDSNESESIENSRTITKCVENGKCISNKNRKRSFITKGMKLKDDSLPIKRRKKSLVVSKDGGEEETASVSSIHVENEPNINTSTTEGSRRRLATNKLEVLSPQLQKANRRKKGAKKSKSAIVDVTHEYEEDEASDYVCGVCESWDVPEHVVKLVGQTTEWIGCDCDR